jgi:hypothetical protein
VKREDIQKGAMQASAMLETAGFKAGMTVYEGRITLSGAASVLF